MRTLIPAIAVALSALSASSNAQTFEAELNNLDPTQGDHVGNGVSIDGDTLLTGAKGRGENGVDAGAAYIFERVMGTWTQTAKLLPAELEAGDEFGVFVGLHDGVAVVGAFHDDDGGGDAGAAYVFEKVASVWTQTAKLIASDASAGAEFGTCVAVHAGTILIGAEGESSAAGGAGAAYTFEKVGGNWQQMQKLTASDPQANDDFGHAVMIDGDLAVIGAQDSDDDGNNSGSAYIFHRAAGIWSQEAKLLAADGAASDRFGRTVSISGARALVGAEFDDDLGSNSGSAYLFERTGTTWNQTHKFTASDGEADDMFSRAVSISGDIVVIGSFGDDDVAANAGAGLVYHHCAAGWVETAKIFAPGGEVNDRNGRTVSVRGTALALGSPLDDSAAPNAGAAYVYSLVGFETSDVCPTFVSSCSGDGGDQNGCTDCPCMNNAPQGAVGGCLNSAGTATELIASGSDSIAAADLRFEAAGAPPNNSAVLTSGNALAPANMANPCFGLNSGIPSFSLDGLRCAVQSVLRHGVRPSDVNGEIGVTTNGWGTPNGFFNFAAFVAGGTKHFQIIHRDDIAAVCMRGQNTSQAVSVAFAP